MQQVPDELESSSLKDGDEGRESGDVTQADNVDGEDDSSVLEESAAQDSPKMDRGGDDGVTASLEEERAKHEENLKREIRAREVASRDWMQGLVAVAE